MESGMRGFRRAACVLSLLILSARAAYCYPPTLLLGGQAGWTWFESPEDGEGVLPLAATSIAAGWSDTSASGRYTELAASARLASYFDSPALATDEERIALRLGLPIGGTVVELASDLHASLMGDGEDPAHLHPSWQAGVRLPGEQRAWTLAYRGSYLYEPEATEDVLYQGLRAAAEWDRSLSLGVLAAGECGWQYWPETRLLDASGAEIDDARQDVLGQIEARLDGLAGFFVRWDLALTAGARWSTANRFVAGVGLEEGSENSVYAALEAAADWSPHRSVGIRLGGFLRQEWYLVRAALDEAGAETGQELRVLAAGLTVRADWTPDNRVFLVLEGSAGRSFANDPSEERWNAMLRAGVEYSF